QKRMAELASSLRLVLCAGSFPERDGVRLYNTAVVYGPAGDRLLTHRKACLYGGAGGAAFSAGAAAGRGGAATGWGGPGGAGASAGTSPRPRGRCAPRERAWSCTRRPTRRRRRAGGTRSTRPRRCATGSGGSLLTSTGLTSTGRVSTGARAVTGC